MATINVYATLAEYKEWIRQGGTDIGTDATDDTQIERILGSASRFIDRETDRTYFPRVQTRQYNVPERGERVLVLDDDDLLEIITLTNGDDVAIAASEYNLEPFNDPPYEEIVLKESSSIYWQEDSDGNTERVEDVLGFWGFHDDYNARAWLTGSAINMAGNVDATEVVLTVDDGALHAVDELIKIDNEIMRVTGIATHDLTVARAENGSTGATHLDDAQVYIWEPMQEIREACLLIAHNVYKKRTGKGVAAVATVTAAGVVISPQDVPGDAMRMIKRLKRGGWG